MISTLNLREIFYDGDNFVKRQRKLAWEDHIAITFKRKFGVQFDEYMFDIMDLKKQSFVQNQRIKFNRENSNLIFHRSYLN